MGRASQASGTPFGFPGHRHEKEEVASNLVGSAQRLLTADERRQCPVPAYCGHDPARSHPGGGTAEPMSTDERSSMDSQPPEWNDPTDPTVVEESHATLVELLAFSDSQRLRDLGDALRDGRLEVSPDEDDRPGTVKAKLCVPTTFGPPSFSSSEVDQLYECLRGAIHAGDAWVGNYRIAYVPARVAWASRQARPAPGGLIGDRYAVGGLLGRGGFAEVHEAVDRITDAKVAVKVLHEQSTAVEQAQALDRMRREMRILHDTSHPNVISILNFGQLEDGRLWYAMPLAGGSLKDRIPTMDRSVSELLVVMEDIAAGLDHLAQSGAIHRDLTPANVLYLEGRWVVADLGMVVDTSRNSEVLTGTGWGVGTERYAPPERLSARDATSAWDIFSFGQLCVDMITGLEAKDRPLGDFPPHAFRPALQRACSNSPLDRFPTAAQFVEECRRLHQIEVNADWESPAERNQRLRRQLAEPATETEAFDAIAALVLTEPEIVDAFIGALAKLSADQIARVAASRPGGFRTVFDAVITELPGKWTQFTALDSMGDFLSRCARLSEDHYPTRALRWLAEVGAGWDRWHVQKLAAGVALSLTGSRVHVLRPALEGLDAETIANAIPDMDVLPPDARPTAPAAAPTNTFDEEPF